MLDGIDTIVIDLQDVGARFYTYMTTMAYVMEEAAKRKIGVVVLDRPNPVNGFDVEGPAQDEAAAGSRLISDADSPWHDARRAGAPLQRENRSAPR